MKGAAAEEPRVMSTPKSSRMMMIGASQYFLFCFIIAKSSSNRLASFPAPAFTNCDLFLSLMQKSKLAIVALQINPFFHIAPVGGRLLVEALLQRQLSQSSQEKTDGRDDDIIERDQQNVADGEANAGRNEIPDEIKRLGNRRLQPE